MASSSPKKIATFTKDEVKPFKVSKKEASIIKMKDFKGKHNLCFSLTDQR